MNTDLLFSAVNASVLPAWALLILAPKWWGTEARMHSMLYPFVLGIFSHWLLIPCLLLTIMFGPVGLVLYLVLRKVTGKGGWRLGVEKKKIPFA